MKNRNEVFIVGFPRSGTTLLASVLGKHSDICTSAETHIFQSRKLVLNKRMSLNQWLDFSAGNKRMKDLGLPEVSDDKYPDIDVFGFYDWFSNYLCEKKRKSLYIEKSPVHTDFLNTISGGVKGAKFIHIVRDPRDSIASLVRAPWAHNDLSRHVAEWSSVVNKVNRFSLENPGRVIEIRYEDFLYNPERVIRDVFDFLDMGLLFEDDMLSGAKGNSDAIPDWEKDWKSNASSSLDTSRVYSWKNGYDTSIDKYLCFSKSELEMFGYEVGNLSERTGLLETLKYSIYTSEVYRRFRGLVKKKTIYD